MNSSVQRTVGYVVLMVVLAVSGRVEAAEREGGPTDKGIATVQVGTDGAPDVERKLGASPCMVPSVTGDTVSYLYNAKDAKGHYFLRLEVNGRVDSITVSKDPPLAGVCYAPLAHTMSLRTEEGLELGATMEEVLRVYGKPMERFAVGSMARFRYVAMLDRTYEWDLVFRDGRLVEWTVVSEE